MFYSLTIHLFWHVILNEWFVWYVISTWFIHSSFQCEAKKSGEREVRKQTNKTINSSVVKMSDYWSEGREFESQHCQAKTSTAQLLWMRGRLPNDLNISVIVPVICKHCFTSFVFERVRDSLETNCSEAAISRVTGLCKTQIVDKRAKEVKMRDLSLHLKACELFQGKAEQKLGWQKCRCLYMRWQFQRSANVILRWLTFSSAMRGMHALQPKNPVAWSAVVWLRACFFPCRGLND